MRPSSEGQLSECEGLCSVCSSCSASSASASGEGLLLPNQAGLNSSSSSRRSSGKLSPSASPPPAPPSGGPAAALAAAGAAAAAAAPAGTATGTAALPAGPAAAPAACRGCSSWTVHVTSRLLVSLPPAPSPWLAPSCTGRTAGELVSSRHAALPAYWTRQGGLATAKGYAATARWQQAGRARGERVQVARPRLPPPPPAEHCSPAGRNG